MEMFCRQCEQTAGGKGCSVSGVCGKTPEVSQLQELLLYVLTGIAVYDTLSKEYGLHRESDVDVFVMEALFSTITNVNFDDSKIAELIYKASDMVDSLRNSLEDAYRQANGTEYEGELPDSASFSPASSVEGLVRQSEEVNFLKGDSIDKDIRSLKEILLYGIKGMAAYADHAYILGKTNKEVNDFFFKALAAIADDKLGVDKLVGLVLECGKENLACMELLDGAHVGHFGSPSPTKVFWGEKPGPAIIVSGHDLIDIEELLKQTEGTGVNVYTHGEMLAAHGYPQLNKYSHLAGHFGTAWQNQQKEFDAVPAVILMTTNCIQKPKTSYSGRIFTTGLVAWPGVSHITSKDNRKDFTPLIEKAKKLGGFNKEKRVREITVGFAHDAVLSVASTVLGLVADKKIRHFFLIGGCDGAKPGRNYYTDFAQKAPKDTLILTLACGKFRINHLELGDIDGIPRLLDCGQCNDAYSAIKIAVALAENLGCGVNDLPLSLILSWYEQKAVCILLTLLYLGIKDIRLGPSLPAFISPNVLNVLVEKFAIKSITTVEEDMKAILGSEMVA